MEIADLAPSSARSVDEMAHAGHVCHLKKPARAGKTCAPERWPSGLRRTLGKRVYGNTVPWVRIPLSPPIAQPPKAPPPPAAVAQANLGLSRRPFGACLWTGRMAGSRVWFSEGSVFSEAVDFADLVHSLKIRSIRPLTM